MEMFLSYDNSVLTDSLIIKKPVLMEPSVIIKIYHANEDTPVRHYFDKKAVLSSASESVMFLDLYKKLSA